MTANSPDKTDTGGGEAGTGVATPPAPAGDGGTPNPEPNAPPAAGSPGDGAPEGGEGSSAPPGVPEAYDLELEGEFGEPGMRESLEASLRNGSLTQEQASKFLGDLIPKLTQHQRDKAETWKAELAETLKADSEFVGKDGRGFDAAAALRDKAIEAVPGGDKLLQWMKESGLINQPGLAKAFRFYGERISEDNVLPGAGRDNPQPAKADMTESEAGAKLYPDM